uniref:NADH dehydrogenase [ubiquinone] 1 alpha subcomplex subunit 12 n=1 Tax=Anolis carolinensis TaxID=28377 RepID=A0A803TGP8_ANOCA
MTEEKAGLWLVEELRLRSGPSRFREDGGVYAGSQEGAAAARRPWWNSRVGAAAAQTVSFTQECDPSISWVNDLKTGMLVGVDKYGNKYYEDKRYFFGRHRWVIYTEEMNGKNTFWEVDGSMVPPEWHRWLHCMTEDPPTTHPPVSRKFIWENHKFNLSGTPGQYVPYSTTRKKIQEWVPPSTPSK